MKKEKYNPAEIARKIELVDPVLRETIVSMLKEINDLNTQLFKNLNGSGEIIDLSYVYEKIDEFYAFLAENKIYEGKTHADEQGLKLWIYLLYKIILKKDLDTNNTF